MMDPGTESKYASLEGIHISLQERKKKKRCTPFSLSSSVRDWVPKPASNSMPMRLKSKCQQGNISSDS